ncbi:MAG: succinate dehydrogenase, hydrophobic membrane anchor protein [Pseudohongiellaceae bacterium]
MVTNITSLGRNGVHDWLVQRISAVVLLAYFVFLVVYVATNTDLSFSQWQNLFSHTWMRVFSLTALLSLCAHAWIGMWTISTDYFTSAMLGSAATVIRLGFQLVCLLILISYFVWCVQILWSI